MKYQTTMHGRTSKDAPATEALREEWRIAAELNEQGGEGEWVPRESVYIREDILPREGEFVDHERVREYATIFRQLPPIVVQKGTFVLIDGRHRHGASFESAASTVCIRITEIDVPDEELREAAFNANRSHGLPYRPKDRIAHLKYLLAKHGDDQEHWRDRDYANECGLSVNAVMDHRHKLGLRRNAQWAEEPGVSSTTKLEIPQITRQVERPSDSRRPIPKPAFKPTEPRTVAVDEDGYVLTDEMSRCADCGERVPEGHDCGETQESPPETGASEMEPAERGPAVQPPPLQERYFAIALRIVSDFVNIDWPAVRESATDEEYRYIRAMCEAVPA